jgi:hypothetical protein
MIGGARGATHKTFVSKQHTYNYQPVYFYGSFLYVCKHFSHIIFIKFGALYLSGCRKIFTLEKTFCVSSFSVSLLRVFDEKVHRNNLMAATCIVHKI